MQKKRQIEPFRVSRESFVPRMRRGRVCGESFVPHMRRGRVCGESFVPHMRRGRVCGESFVPRMRRGRVCGESLVPKRQGVVVVGRIMPCSGVVLVPVGGLWRRPGAAHGHRSQALQSLPRPPRRWWWGFCSIRSWLAVYLRRVAALMMQFPPIGGSDAAT